MSSPVSRRQMAKDLSFSQLAWGAWRLRNSADIRNTGDILELVHACLDSGITTFDHADVYGGYECEAYFGEALAKAPELRRKMEIVTKCGVALVKDTRPDHRINHYNTTKAHILQSVENRRRDCRSLQRTSQGGKSTPFRCFKLHSVTIQSFAKPP